MNDDLIEKQSQARATLGQIFDFEFDQEEKDQTESSSPAQAKEKANEAKNVQNDGHNKSLRDTGINKDSRDNSLKKSVTNTQEAKSSEMMNSWAKMVEEYTQQNEKEIPSHSSKVIHHVLHPFVDQIQDSFTHLTLENPEALLAEEIMGSDRASLAGKQLNQSMNGSSNRQQRVEKSQLQQQDHMNNIDANAFEYLIVLEELQFPTQHIEVGPSASQDTDLPEHSPISTGKYDDVQRKGGVEDGKKNNHIEKYPIRMLLQRGESQTFIPNQLELNQKHPNRSQSDNQKKNPIGDSILGQASAVKMIEEEKKKQIVTESRVKKKSYNIQQESSEGSESDEETSHIQSRPLQKSVLNVSINSEEQKKQPKNSVQYEYQSWLRDQENENMQGNMGDNLNTSQPKNNDFSQTETQQEIILTQLNPLMDERASNYEQQPMCKLYRLSMWRIDRIQQTKIIVASQLVTFWNPDVSVFMGKLFFSVDGLYLFFLLKNKSDQTFIKALAFDSKTLKQVPHLSFGEETLKSVAGKGDFVLGPQMFKLSEEYMNDNGSDAIHDESKIQEEEKLSNRKELEDNKGVNYAMYFQDRQKGYFLFKSSKQNVEMNLIIEGSSAIVDLGYDSSDETYSQLASSRPAQKSISQVGSGRSKEKLEIVNMFFGMSENEDSAIIISKFINNITSDKMQNLLKTQVLSLSTFITELRKSPRGRSFNPINKEQGVLRTTDYFTPQNFYINGKLEIKTSFYHKRHGIFIKTSTEIDQQRALDDTGNRNRNQLILFIPQNVLTKNQTSFKIRYFCTEDFRLPLNPQLHSQLCFKDKVNKQDYLILVQDLLLNKLSVESIISNQSALEISNFYEVPKAYDDKQEREKFMDFIITLGKKNSMSVADVDIESSQAHLKRPFIVFYDNQDQEFQQVQCQTAHPLIKIDKQVVQYNEPYILAVEDQITLNIYSTIFPDRTYTLNLQNHFEFFLDIPAGDVVINKIRYFRHQVCMMVTYELASKCHRIECLIMPSFKDMMESDHKEQMIRDQSFKVITLQYKFKINLGVLQPFTVLRDKVISAQFLQFRQPTQFISSRLDAVYDPIRRQDSLLIQLKDSVMMYDLQNSKYQLQNELMTYQGKIKVLKTHGYGLLRDDDTKKLASKDYRNEEELRNTLGDPQIYFVYQRASMQDLQAQNKLILLIVNVYCENQFRYEIIHEFPKQAVTKKIQDVSRQDDDFSDEILQIALAEDDPEGTSILVLDKNFVVQKLKLAIKNNDFEVKVEDESLPNEQALKLWMNVKENFIRQRIRMPENSIQLKDHGIFLDNSYFQYFSKNNLGREHQSMVDFELQRNKLVSFKFAQSSHYLSQMNFSGPTSSPDQMTVMMQFARYMGTHSEVTAKTSIFSGKKNTLQLGRQSVKKQHDFDSKSNQDSKQPDSNSFFLVLPHMASKIANLIPIDTFAKEEIEYSSFLGTEDDDILIKIKNHFIIFNSNGRLIQLQAEMIPPDFVMSDYKVKEMLLCQRSNQSGNKGQIQLEKDKQIDDDYLFRILMINKANKQYALLSIKRKPKDFNKIGSLAKKLNYAKTYMLKVEEHNKEIVPVILSTQESSIVSHIKLTPNGDVVKFLLKQRIGSQGKQNVQQNRFSERESDSNKLDQDSVQFYINDKRNKYLEDKIRLTIISEKNTSIRQENLDAQKQAEDQKEKLKESIKILNQNGLDEFLIDGSRNAFVNQKSKIFDEENQANKTASNVNGTDLKYSDHDFDHLFLQKDANGDQYFVFKSGINLYFDRINLQKIQDKNNNNNTNLTKFDLKLSNRGEVYQILPVKSKQHVQFLYYDWDSKNFHMFVWNLGATCTKSTNQEEQMQKFKPNKQSPFSILIKGSKLRENYIFFQGTDSYMDLRLDFPLNFLSGKKAWSPMFNPDIDFDPETNSGIVYSVYDKYVNEMKICSKGSHCLGLYGLALAQIQRSYCFIDLQYMRYLQKKFFDDKTLREMSYKSLLLDHLSVMLPYQCNLLQYFALNQQFLQLYLKEIIQKLDEALDERQQQAVLNFAYYPLFPNSLPVQQTNCKGRRPFSLALKSNQAACFELLLQILMTDPKRDYIMHIKTYLTQLMVWRGDIVHTFLNTRCQKYLFTKMVPSVKGRQKFGIIKSCKEQNPEAENYNDSVTLFINDKKKFQHLNGDKETIKKEANQKNKEVNNKNQDKKYIVEKKFFQECDDPISDDEQEQNTINQFKLIHQTKQNEQYFSPEKSMYERAVNFNAFDFQNQLVGRKAEILLRFLTKQQNNLRIFELKHVQTLLEYSWGNIKTEYYVILGIYIIKILFMFIYVVLDDRLINCTNSDFTDVESEHQCSQAIEFKINNTNFDISVFIIGMILFVTQIFLTHYELKKYLQVPTLSTMVIFIFNIINLVKLGTDKFFLLQFESAVYHYNLQSDLGLDYTTKIDRRYQDRMAMFYILIQRAGNAFMFITLPLILFYKIRFLPFVNFYVPRFFLAVAAIFPLTMIFMGVYCFLFFAQSILQNDLKYNLGNTEKDLVTPTYDSIFDLIRWLDYVNLVYRSILQVTITTISILFFCYVGASMTKADTKATKELQLQKFLNMANIMIENSFLINKEEKYHNARYVIVSCKEKSKTITNGKEDVIELLPDDNQEKQPGGEQLIDLKKDLGSGASFSQMKELFKVERVKTEQSLQEIKSMIAAVKEIQMNLTSIDNTGPK